MLKALDLISNAETNKQTRKEVYSCFTQGHSLRPAWAKKARANLKNTQHKNGLV
jgi:hypothetical protein